MKSSSNGASSASARAVAPAAQAANFKGTLLLLQNKTKRDPESYYEEFLAQLRHFDALSKVATTTQRLIASTNVNAAKSSMMLNNNPDAAIGSGEGSTTQQQAQEDAQFTAVLNYLCHVSGCYPKECAHIPDVLLKALSTTGPKMNPTTRRNFVENLMLLRSKGLVTPEKTLPVLFDLLLIRDKLLRKAVLGHIVSDIRRFNMPKAKGAQQSNKVVQNFLFSVVTQDDPTQTRCALLVMIDLYRRGIWANEKCVEVLAQACFSKHTRIVRTALRFFLMQFPKISSLDDPDDDEGEFDAKQITETMTRAMHKHKAKAKTKYRKRVLKRDVKNLKKKLDPELREKAAFDRQDIDPIRLLRDPQSFTERLLSQLQRTSERFEVRLLYLSVIARVVSEHHVVVLPLYSYLERFLQPNQIQAPTILALTSTCAHPLVPPDALESLVRSIANHFVNDRSQPDAITIGINTIREICKRQPLAMSEDLLKDLVEYRSMRGERGIIMAARSLIQLYRSVDPTLLPTKLRGATYDKEESAAKRPVFGAHKPLMDIPGMEALYGDDELENEEQNLSGFEDQLGEDAAKKNDDDDDDSDSNASDDSSSMIDIPLSDSDGGGDLDDWEFCDEEDAEEGEEINSNFDEKDDDDDEESDEEDDDDLLDEEDDEELMDFDDEEMMLDEEEDGDDDSDDQEEDDEQLQQEAKLLAQKRTRKVVDEDVWEESDDEQDQQPSNKKNNKKAATAASTRAPVKAHKNESDDLKTSSALASKKKKSAPVDDDDDVAPQLVSTADILAQKPSAASGSGWFEDTTTTTKPAKTKKQQQQIAQSSASSSVGAAGTFASSAGSRVSSMRLLTEEDFEKLRKIQEGLDPNEWRSARGRKKAIMELKKKKNALTTPGMGVGQVDESAIESFTNRKRSEDKAEKIAKAQELRKQRSPFELRKKRKSKLNSTHGEKSKKGKLFAMTKRSARVGAKLKMSVEDKREKAKDLKKKNIKFRINRGWKA